MSATKKREELRVIIAGGGTGGHLFPAIAIHEALAASLKERKLRAVFIGTRRGLEARLLPKLGLPIRYLCISGFVGKSPLRKLLSLAQIAISFFQSLAVLVSFRPHVVVGTGGFAAGPILACAQLLGIPTMLQEQNAFPGVTTRLLARRARRVCVHFPETNARLPHPERVHVTGNPVRHFFVKVEREQARNFWELDSKRPVLLVFGGSLGARSINNALADAIPRILEKSNVIWQTGRMGVPEKADRPFCDEMLASHRLVVREFIDEMPMAYGAANLALCRAGAMTLSELALVGLPAILIPFPFAAHQHQDWNARAYESAGAALRIGDAELNGESLCQTVLPLLNETERLNQMKAAMQTLAKPNAAEDIAKMICELGGVL
jgi:UDP-N-acetylglucosamine--N-acetylmuramyl-(pentapeptide) pyrophosphoryl-undecaprenol N-acetylglucosamine transferase